MAGAQTPIRQGFLQSDLDARNFKIINLDISNLIPPTVFPVVDARKFFGGPSIGSAVPDFRLLLPADYPLAMLGTNNLSEITTPATARTNLGLTSLATTTPGAIGAQLIALGLPGFTAFLEIVAGVTSFKTPAEVLTDIAAQPYDIKLKDVADLADPNIDRILFWDDSAGGFRWLGVGTNLSITGTTIDAPTGDAPFEDTKAILKGVDPTKQLRFEIDGFTAGATRVLTPPDYNGQIATLAGIETFTNKSLTDPLMEGGTHNGLTSFGIRSINAAFDLIIDSTDVFSSDKHLELVLGNANRKLIFGGNLEFAGAFSTVGAFNIVLNATANTNIVLPTTGTVATLAGTESLTNKVVTGELICTAPIELKEYTVGTLPTGKKGDYAFVNDATTPTFLAAVAGGGSTVTPVFHDGADWVCG